MLGSPEAGIAQSGIVLRLLDNMSRSTARLERLITDLLDVATARSGGLSLYSSPVDMVSIIEQVVDEMTPAANDRDVTIVGKWRKKQGLMVTGDEIRLQQIVANILSNAIKAAPVGGIVRVEATKAAPHAKISVANPSVRLDPEVKDKLFEPFQKSSAGGYKPGAGLGLSVVDSLVKAHGGRISVEDTGRQVRFTFTIPLWRKGASE
ncbi:MAG: HAMP domain-containing sensor histidine kinase [SAR202 cluster bacterium]|jgi:signal transduction histidine kinase|nr:HAMP domain-containing sensor histidine kinase [SAR202 cluster bacterium]MDP6512787.1 HAMP domain-containing sensor histidine kinase [SAR202 cluster bacterium]MDP6713693.1 HAMP domain-containing sensor histidine kinase [SAR202 cluster bacterium]